MDVCIFPSLSLLLGCIWQNNTFVDAGMAIAAFCIIAIVVYDVGLKED